MVLFQLTITLRVIRSQVSQDSCKYRVFVGSVIATSQDQRTSINCQNVAYALAFKSDLPCQI